MRKSTPGLTAVPIKAVRAISPQGSQGDTGLYLIRGKHAFYKSGKILNAPRLRREPESIRILNQEFSMLNCSNQLRPAPLLWSFPALFYFFCVLCGFLIFLPLYNICRARMAELADAQDLGSCTLRCGGSSPPSRTTLRQAQGFNEGNIIDPGDGW